MLAWQNWQADDPASGLALGDMQVTQVPVETRTARMDLTFSLAECFTETGEPAGISGEVEFRTDVFDAASIQTLIGRLERVLVESTADPTRRLSSVDVLDAGERARLDGWGNRAVLTQPATASVSIPALFAAQVARAPEAVAVSCGERSWTYRELDEAANRFARLLANQVWARDSVWRCCSPGRPRRSWRCWQYSKPVRRICRSTPRTRRPGSSL